MNKAQLIEAVASKAGLSKSQAEKALNTTLEAISQSVKKGENVTLIGFGTFGVSKRAARKGKNPRTGEAIKIAARKVPKFSAGQSFKDLVNGTAKPKAAKAAPAKAAAPAPATKAKKK